MARRKDRKARDDYRAIGIATSIPFVMVASPLVGFFAGRWLDQRFDTAPVLTLVLGGVGLVSGLYEAYRLVKRLDASDGVAKKTKDQ